MLSADCILSAMLHLACWQLSGGPGGLECLSVLQVKMPSKKFAHIPVYTLGFESPPRVPTAKVTLAQRRDAFQCVPALGDVPVVGRHHSHLEAGRGPMCWGGVGLRGQSPGPKFLPRKSCCGMDFALPDVGAGGCGDSGGPLTDPSCPRPLQGPHWRSVEEEFPHIYTHGCVLKDVCSDCTGFVADVVRSSRRSVDALNTTPRRARQTQSLYVPNTWTLDLK